VDVGDVAQNLTTSGDGAENSAGDGTGSVAEGGPDDG